MSWRARYSDRLSSLRHDDGDAKIGELRGDLGDIETHRWAQYRTPIRSLYLCGSGTHPGGGVTGLPGYNAAREIISDVLKRKDRADNTNQARAKVKIRNSKSRNPKFFKERTAPSGYHT